MNLAVTLAIVAIMWMPPALAIATNQTDPSIGTALGVAYAFLAGLALSAVAMAILAVASRRWSVLRPHYSIVAVAAFFNIVLFVMADRGMLSIIH